MPNRQISPHPSHPGYRPEIDGLRAVAVLAVVVYHAFPALLTGGFVGVDVFFVISGYVITATIFRRREAGSFTFRDFYARRVRRLFPALILVLAASLGFGWFALLADEYRLLGKHAAAAAAFVPNVVLWLDTGYFDPLADARPLLHLWSLGVEEQFYFLWPAALLMVLGRGRALVGLVATIAVISLGAALVTTGPHPAFAFYLPFTRFWELLAGAALAIGEHRGSAPSNRNGAIIAVVGLAMIAATSLLIHESDPFPGWRAIPPVAGAALVIVGARAGNWPSRALGWEAVRYVGLISYPLYLWHWPLLSFLSIAEMQAASWHLRVPAVILSVALAAATYHWVERPFRYRLRARTAVVTLLAGMFATGLAGFAIMRADGMPQRHADGRYADTGQLEWPYWRNPACDRRYPYEGANQGWWFCMTNRDSAPTVILLGNSFANHLYPGLVRHPAFAGDTILSIGTCDPAIGLHWDTPAYGENHPCHGANGERQERFVSEVIDSNPSLRLAVLSSAWPDFDANGRLLGSDGRPSGSVSDRRQGQSTMLQTYIGGLERRIADLQRHRIVVVLVLPKPELGYDVRACLDRPFHDASQDCRIDRGAAAARPAMTRAAMIALATRFGVATVDPFDVFCDRQSCSYMAGKVPLLRDTGHYSVAGSRRIADHIARAAPIDHGL